MLNPTRTRDSYLLIGPYDGPFIDALKEGIPSRARRWDPVRKAWSIDAEFAEVACELIAEHSQIEAPSDVIGLDIVDTSGAKIGKVAGVAPKPGARGGLAVLASLEPAKVSSFDELRELSESLGVSGGSAEVWEALALVAEPTSVTVREVDGKRVIIAELS